MRGHVGETPPGNYLSPEALQVTRAVMAANMRSDGTYNATRIAQELGIARSTAQYRIDAVLKDGEGQDVPHEMAREAWIDGPAIELVSRNDNTFCFGAFGDLHAASKYCRWDVREDLVRRAEHRGAQAIFDTGNWIDGDARFNQFDVEERGMERQLQLLATKHPKTNLEIYAVTGDDHEGWYAQREGVNIGRYCQTVMRQAGHKWTDLGYMESHVRLKNANTGQSQIMAVNHPGGGSAYALSYRPQKIVEALEGGEKPAVMLIGHYHKLECVIVRNVWVLQTGCFTAATKIETREGRRRISEIRVGDEVLTHKGRYRPVISLFKRKHEGDFVSINYGRKGRDDQTVTATTEHPILIERDDGSRVWVSFEDVREGDTIFVTGRDCPVSGSRMPFYMNLSKHASPMDKEEARKAASDAAKRRSDYAGGRLKRSEAEHKHMLNDILPFCEVMREDGWQIVPVGNSVTPDAIGFKDGKVVAFELEKSGGALLQFKQKKYDDAPINKFVDEVRWVDLTPRIEQPRSWYEPDEETGFVKVKVLSVSRSPVRGANNRKSVTVYNFEVAEDNSYVAGHAVVHNCQQDQSPFMRKKGIEAHVGGIIVTLEQDPKTGAIIGCTPEILRYFNRDYYSVSGRWSHHGPVRQPTRRR